MSPRRQRDRQPTLLVRTRVELDLGGRTVMVQAWPPAHTDDDLTVFDVPTGTLWLSDLLFVGHTPVIDGTITGFLAVMERSAQIEAQHYVAGHGRASPWPQVLEAQQRYFTVILEETRAAIRSRKTIQQATDEVGLSEAENGRLRTFPPPQCHDCLYRARVGIAGHPGAVPCPGYTFLAGGQRQTENRGRRHPRPPIPPLDRHFRRQVAPRRLISRLGRQGLPALTGYPASAKVARFFNPVQIRNSSHEYPHFHHCSACLPRLAVLAAPSCGRRRHRRKGQDGHVCRMPRHSRGSAPPIPRPITFPNSADRMPATS